MTRMFFGLKMRFSLAFMLIAAFQLIAVLPARGQVGTYTGTLSDLAGVWNFNTLSSGTDVSRWSRGTITIIDDGTYTASGRDISANVVNFSGGFSISSDGLTMSQTTGSSNTLCQVDTGKTLIACTQTESDDSTTLVVAAKEAASCSQGDLAGTWQLNRLSSWPTNQWMRSTVTIKKNGTFTDSQTNSDGTKKTKTGVLSISSGGEVTVVSCPLCNDSDREILMDSGKTLMVGTSTKSDGTAQLEVFARRAVSYSAADLPGTWEMNTLASGPYDGANYWIRSTVTVDPDGTYIISGTDSNGNPGSVTGKFSISSAGVITCPTCISGGLRMVMDSGKTSIVYTDSSPLPAFPIPPGTTGYQMSILTRNPLTITGTLQTSGGSPMAGVSVALTGGSGPPPSPVTTDSSGAYSFGGLINGKYKVTPSGTGYVFAPKIQTVTLTGKNATQNFTGTPVTISGTVLPYKSLGRQGITINLSGAGTQATPTDNSGNYIFNELANGVYKVTPVPPAHSPALTFSPARVSIAITGKSAKPQNFKYKTNKSCSKCH